MYRGFSAVVPSVEQTPALRYPASLDTSIHYGDYFLEYVPHFIQLGR